MLGQKGYTVAVPAPKSTGPKPNDVGFPKVAAPSSGTAVNSKYSGIENLETGFRYDQQRDEIYRNIDSNTTEQQLADIRNKYSSGGQATTSTNQTSGQQTPGVFTNKTTGQQVDKYGNPINQGGTPGLDIGPTTGEDLVNAQMLENADKAKELGLDAGPKSITELVDEYKAGKQSEKDYLTKQQQYQREAEQSQLNQSKKSAESGIEATKASLLQGREGVTSSGRPAAVAEYTAAAQENINLRISQYESAELARNKAVKDLEEAQKRGDQSLVEELTTRIKSADLEIERSKTALLDAQSRASEDALRVQDFELRKEESIAARSQKSFDQFSSFLMTGATMTPEGLQQMAKQLDIPFELAFETYNSMQMIRDDKNMDAAQKEIEMQSALKDLDDKMRGITNQTLQNVDFYTKALQSGAYSDEELSGIKEMLGITDKNDPLYQVNLRKQDAEARLSELEAANFGQPPRPGTKEYIEYKQAQLDLEKSQFELDDIKGQSGEYRVEMDDIYQDVFPVGKAVGWCGVFASTVSTGPKVGNSWSEKKQRITHRDNPQAGNKLLIPLGVKTDAGNGNGEYGHVAVVLDYNEITGDIKVVESNKDGRQNPPPHTNLGVATIGTYNINELNSMYGSNWGFTPGQLKDQYANSINQQRSELEDALAASDGRNKTTMSNSPTDIVAYNEFISSGGKNLPSGVNEKAFKAQVNDFVQKRKDPSLPLQEVLNYTIGGRELTDGPTSAIEKNIMTTQQLQDLQESISSLDSSDFGPIQGILSSNNPLNTKAQELKAQLTAIVPGLARGVYGEVGVLTEADIKNYMATLPNLNQTEDVQRAVLEMTQRVVNRGLENKLRTYASAGYNLEGFGWVADSLAIPELGSSDLNFAFVGDPIQSAMLMAQNMRDMALKKEWEADDQGSEMLSQDDFSDLEALFNEINNPIY